MITKILLALGCVAFSGAVFAAEPAALPNPEAWGPYSVGVTTTLLEDGSRLAPGTGKPRALPTEIWYPSVEQGGGAPKNRLLDFFAQRPDPEWKLLLLMAFNADMTALDATFQNQAHRDAPVRSGKYPLILFSHGNGGMRMQNAFWCEHLASHGYIVMAPDHTGNCAVTFVGADMVVFNESKEARAQSALDRPKDISFLIDAMGRMNAGADSRFRGKVDMNQIGVGGHSFGGFTATWVAAQDPRVKAIVPMAGVAQDAKPHALPTLLFIASEDDTLGKERNQMVRDYPARLTGPKYVVDFKNGGHYSFTEIHQLNPAFGDGVGQGKRITNGEAIAYPSREVCYRILNGYSTAFFGKYLKGQEGYQEYLTGNACPAELLTSHP